MVKKLNFRQRIFFAIVGVNLLFMTTIVVFDAYKDTVWLRSVKKQNLTKIENKVKQLYDEVNRKKMSQKESLVLFREKIEQIILPDNVGVVIYDLGGEVLIGKANEKMDSKIKSSLATNDGEFFSEQEKENTIVYHLYDFLDENNKELGVVDVYEETDKLLVLTNIKILIKQYLLAIIIMFILSGYVAWFISKALMNRVKILEKQLPRTNIEFLDTPIVEYYGNDEITPLIESYNNMLRKLKQQTEQLTLIEREESWREMAKQIIHEIRNPLTPLKLLIQNFQRKFNPEDTDNLEKVNKLSEAVIHQVEVINSITQTFSDYSKAPLRNNPIDIVKALKCSLDIFPENIIVFDTKEEELYYPIDEAYFTRIITNIVKNGIQAIPHKEKKITVQLTNNTGSFLITIKDNGEGISMENQDKIFERKFTTKSTGMGLGLSIVKKIVEDYNGKIWFDTKEGEGTIFYIEFYK